VTAATVILETPRLAAILRLDMPAADSLSTSRRTSTSSHYHPSSAPENGDQRLNGVAVFVPVTVAERIPGDEAGMEHQAVVALRCLSPATNNAIRHPTAVLYTGETFKFI
jgi:hypothetical protein